MIATAPKCDTPGCGKTRTTVNHWFAVRKTLGLTIYKWDDAEGLGLLDECKHFCGQTHALQFVSSEMGK